MNRHKPSFVTPGALRHRVTKLSASLVATGALLLVVGLSSAAQAQSPSYGLGQQGAPTAADYLDVGKLFAGGIGPILTTLLPLLLGMLAVWQGPRIVKHLVLMFSGGDWHSGGEGGYDHRNE